MIDMGSSYLKTCMFVFVLGVNKDTIFVIYDTILCLFIELCFMCASLFFFLSHKSLHGQIEATARLVCVSLYLKDSMFYMIQCFVCLVLQLYTNFDCFMRVLCFEVWPCLPICHISFAIYKHLLGRTLAMNCSRENICYEF